MENKKKNFLFILGTNIERTKIKAYNRAISRDRDIKRLIRQGNHTRTRVVINFLACLIALCLGALTCARISPVIEVYKKLLSGTAGIASILALLTYAVSVPSLFQYVSELKGSAKETRKCVHHILSGRALKTPLELWSVLVASIMDAQLTTSAERLFNTDASVIYGGMPYYEPMVIDSVYIRWNGLTNRSYHELKRHFKKFFREYARKTILGEVEQKYFSSERRLQVSNCVFGILFFSEYLQNFIGRFNLQHETKFFIDCTNVTDKSNTVSPQCVQAAKEVMGYVTNPKFFTFHKECTTGNISLKICRLDFMDDDAHTASTFWKKLLKALESARCNHQYKKNKILRIPLKKLVVLPVKQSNPKNPLPGTMYQPEKVSDNFEAALVLGGAEQNSVLSNLINTYKWRYDGDKEVPAEYHNLGFAENILDSSGLTGSDGGPSRMAVDADYMIGTEGFVYGSSSRIYAKEDYQGNHDTHMAEIFKLTINEFPYYFIYGYHAVATKIATLKFFIYLEKGDKDNIPSDHNRRITYKLYSPDGGAFAQLRNYWDEGDPINRDKAFLEEKLNSIGNKVY